MELTNQEEKMRKYESFFILFSLLFIAMLIMGCTGMQEHKQDQKTAIIELEGNPTTGYTWVCAISPEGIVVELSKDYVPNENEEKLVGSGGKFFFTFEAIAEGAADLTFSYLRTWEEGIPAIKTESYKAIVDNRNNLTFTRN